MNTWVSTTSVCRSHGSLGCSAPRQTNSAKFVFRDGGLHWECLDDDISVAGLLAGSGDLSALRDASAA